MQEQFQYWLTLMKESDAVKANEWVSARQEIARQSNRPSRTSYSITFTETGIGTKVVLREDATQAELDLSNYEDW